MLISAVVSCYFFVYFFFSSLRDNFILSCLIAFLSDISNSLSVCLCILSNEYVSIISFLFLIFSLSLSSSSLPFSFFLLFSPFLLFSQIKVLSTYLFISLFSYSLAFSSTSSSLPFPLFLSMIKRFYLFVYFSSHLFSGLPLILIHFPFSLSLLFFINKSFLSICFLISSLFILLPLSFFFIYLSIYLPTLVTSLSFLPFSFSLLLF